MKTFILLGVLLCAACSGPEPLPQCTQFGQHALVQAGEDSGVNETAGCFSGRALVSCFYGHLTEVCLSDSAEHCPDSTSGSCENLCEPGEYAISCSAAAPGVPSLPNSCRMVTSSPGGPAYCCSCQ